MRGPARAGSDIRGLPLYDVLPTRLSNLHRVVTVHVDPKHGLAEIRAELGPLPDGEVQAYKALADLQAWVDRAPELREAEAQAEKCRKAMAEIGARLEAARANLEKLAAKALAVAVEDLDAAQEAQVTRDSAEAGVRGLERWHDDANRRHKQAAQKRRQLRARLTAEALAQARADA